MNLRRAARLLAAVGIVGGTTFVAAPLSAHHSIVFDDCDQAPSPTPDADPDLTPVPTEHPDGEPPPPGEEPTPAPQNCMPAENERIWGNRLVKFSTSTDGARPLMRVALSIISEEKAIPDPGGGEPLLEETYSRDEDVRSYDTPFSWNSVEATPYNGKYRIRVDVDTYPPVTGDEPHTESKQRIHLRVDNPPHVLPAPKVIAATLTSVTLQWTPATEPDVLSYAVYRAFTQTKTKPPFSAFKPYAATTGAAYRDGKVPPGFYWYSVKVTRRSVVTPDTGISSTLSPMSVPAEVKSPVQAKKEAEKGPQRKIPFRDLSPPVQSRLASVADAPFAYKLPAEDAPPGGSALEGGGAEGGSTDPRGPVLPVAVGMFLLSSALAVGRMPY